MLLNAVLLCRYTCMPCNCSAVVHTRGNIGSFALPALRYKDSYVRTFDESVSQRSYYAGEKPTTADIYWE